MEQYPVRKPNRLKTVRYNENGAYFITICSINRKCIFWLPAIDAALRRPPKCLSNCGRLVAEEIERINSVYDGVVHVDHSVVMPNHVHLLLTIYSTKNGEAPTIPRVLNQFKGSVSKKVGFACWQKSYHDHIVRDVEDYLRAWEYIDQNPGEWEEDCYYAVL